MHLSMQEQIDSEILDDLISGPGFLNSFWGYKQIKVGDDDYATRMVKLLRMFRQTR